MADVAKERLTTRFFEQATKAALSQVDQLTAEIAASKETIAAEVALNTKLQQDLAISNANILHLRKRCELLEAATGTVVGEFTAKVAALEAQVVDETAKTAQAVAEKTAAEGTISLLQAQLKLLSDIIKSGGALAPSVTSQMASFAAQCAAQFDAANNLTKLAGVESLLATAQKELHDTRYLHLQERMQARQASLLLHVHQQFLTEHLRPSGLEDPIFSPVLGSLALPPPPEGTTPPAEVAKLTLLELTACINEGGAARNTALSLRKQLEEATRQINERNTAITALEAAVAQHQATIQTLNTAASQAEMNGAMEKSNAQRKLVEQGSATAITLSFLSSPMRCLHCQRSLSDTAGLEMLAHALEVPNISDLLTLAVRSIVQTMSRSYEETYAHAVAAVTPPVDLSQSQQLLGQVPVGLLCLPVPCMVEILRTVAFVSEAQAYALALLYLTSSPRLIVSAEIIDAILDTIHFLWLNVSLVESEISRLEKLLVQSQQAMMQGKGFVGSSVGPAGNTLLSTTLAQQKSVLLPRYLLARLTQTLRFKSSVFQFTSVTAIAQGTRHRLEMLEVQQAAEAAAGRSITQDPLLDELHRVRPSYCFLPTSLKVGATATVSANGEPKLQVPAGTLIELQPLCV